MKRNWSIPILAAALVALALLAALQYRWVDQVSAGERERVQAGMHTAAERFSEDFDREMARIYLTFQMDATTLRGSDWARYAQRIDRWASAAPYPQLVDGIYLVRVGDDGVVYLERFNKTSRRFESLPWPPELGTVRQRLIQSVRSAHVADGVITGQLPDPVAAEVPALLIPVARTYLLSNPNDVDIEARFLFGSSVLRSAERPCPRCDTTRIGPLFAHTFVTLNRHYLEDQFIPALARRYFTSGGTFDYRLAVAPQGDPTKVIYRSDAEATANDGDETIGLFSVRLDELNRFLIDDTLRLDDLENDKDPRSTAITVGVVGRAPSSDNQDAPYTPEPPAWQLVVTHRAGSLDAAMTELRWRNLLISFSTLLLLAGSILLMVISTRRAQRLAEQKIDFVTTVSHELRTPLAIIRSAGDNLADGIIHDPQQTRQYGAVIRGEGQRLSEMVDQVMEYAGVQSGRKSYEATRLEVGEVIAAALAACRMQISMHGFTVEEAIDPGLPAVFSDETALRSALQNLIGNALKYSAEERWVRVSARSAQTARGPEVQIAVEDRGMGIAPADLPYIFEPFYRGRDVITAQIHGSGLGLSLVKHSIDAQGGRVTVETTYGHGSVFTIHLPVPALPSGERRPASASI